MFICSSKPTLLPSGLFSLHPLQCTTFLPTLQCSRLFVIYFLYLYILTYFSWYIIRGTCWLRNYTVEFFTNISDLEFFQCCVSWYIVMRQKLRVFEINRDLTSLRQNKSSKMVITECLEMSTLSARSLIVFKILDLSNVLFNDDGLPWRYLSSTRSF